MMTRKHFEKIANILQKEIEDEKLRLRLTSRFGEWLCNENPNFDYEKFKQRAWVKMKFNVGDKVKVVRQNFGDSFIGRMGIVTSIGRGMLSIHVKLFVENMNFDIDNPAISENSNLTLLENHETDFTEDELEVR